MIHLSEESAKVKSPGPAPMEARLVSEMPEGSDWHYEPKWDGFRALVSRSGRNIEILSKSGKSLARYFPEIVARIAAVKETDFMVDGELIIEIEDVLAFDALQARLHPAPSRIAKLSRATPARLMLFDILCRTGEGLAAQPFGARRKALIDFHQKLGDPAILLTPSTCDLAIAKSWLARSGGALDGVVAKSLSDSYRFGERAMLKVKQIRSADCVVGGYRLTKDGTGVASLLLGLHGTDGRLDYVGFTSGMSDEQRLALLPKLASLAERPGFTGKAPGGSSRWNSGEENEWQPLRNELVVEVLYDQVTGNRFRHGTKFHRWRPDKAPAQCGMDQLIHELRPAELATVAL